MMRAKANPKATSTSIMALACVLLVGSIVGLVLPKPSAKKLERDEKAAAKKLAGETALAKAQMATADAIVTAHVWTGEPSAIQNQALTRVSALAKTRGVTLVRFQPQRNPVTSTTLEQLPFLVVVEGTFPAVSALERDLENPGNKLAVNLFQVGSSDSESNAVTANIGIVAHRVPPVVEEKKDKKNASKRA